MLRNLEAGPLKLGSVRTKVQPNMCTCCWHVNIWSFFMRHYNERHMKREAFPCHLRSEYISVCAAEETDQILDCPLLQILCNSD